MIVASRTGLAGVLAACLLIHPAVGAVTWVHFEKAAVKRDVSERLRRGVEEDELVVLEFSLEQAQALLHWESPREFEYRGRMYDLIETRILGQTVVYKCWKDDEETRLNNRLKELAPQESGETLDPKGDELGGRLPAVRPLPCTQCRQEAHRGLRAVSEPQRPQRAATGPVALPWLSGDRRGAGGVGDN